MRSITKKICCISMLIILIFNITGCKLTLKAGIIKHGKNDAQTKVEVIEYQDKLDYIQSRFDTLEKSLLTSKMNDEAITNIFENFLTEIEIEYTNLYFVTEDDGKTFIYPTMTLPEDYDGRTRDWYVQTKEKGYYVSSLYKEAKAGENILTYTRALFKQDELLGVIGIDIVVK